MIFTTKGFAVGGLKAYNPPAPENISNVLMDFQKYMGEEQSYDVLIQAALVYYQFSTIQPFLSDNDKMARILTFLFLMKRNILPRPDFCLSYFLCFTKIECNDRLDEVRRYMLGDYGQWIKYFIRALSIAAEKSANMIMQMGQLWNQDKSKIQSSTSLSNYLPEVFDYIWENPVIDISQIEQCFKISYNTAAKIVHALVKLEILQQSNQQQRYRKFVYKGLLNIFEDSAELFVNNSDE